MSVIKVMGINKFKEMLGQKELEVQETESKKKFVFIDGEIVARLAPDFNVKHKEGHVALLIKGEGEPYWFIINGTEQKLTKVGTI